MIRVRKDEHIRRKYDAKIKGYGDGTLFLTSKRLCFESSKHGVCFNLELAHVWDWLAKKKKKKIRIRWQELHPGQSAKRLKNGSKRLKTNEPRQATTRAASRKTTLTYSTR